MKYKAIIFDFDGVLADSVEVKTEAFASLFESFGPEIQARVIEHHRQNGGMTRAEKFKLYYKDFLKSPINNNELERLCKKFSSLVVDEVVASSEIEGAGAFLEKWYKRIKCFVNSATPDDEIREIILRRGMKHYFWEVCGSNFSKAENIKYLIKKYRLFPSECLFLGDAVSDYQAARSCTVDFIGILSCKEAPLLKAFPNIKWIKNFKTMDGNFLS